MINKKATIPGEKNSLKFYLWAGLAFLSLWLFSELANNRATFSGRAMNNIWRVAYVTIANYFFYEYVIRRFTKKRIFISILLIIAFIMLFSWGLLGWRTIGIWLHIYTPYIVFTKAAHGASDQFSFSMSAICYFGVVRHVYSYIKLREATQQLRIEKQAAELNYLKSQTNPHFLFNTLNNIYSLARDKSDLAPESILRLSKILRFMLYETSGAYIAIEQELKIISDYIALEQLRYDESLHVNFNHDVEDLRQALPPLLLIPLVENAFKHGVSETRGRAFVEIHLSVNKRQLTFIVKNSSEGPAEGTRVKENIGLSNLRRQLELLYSDYELSVHQGNSVFTSTLKINLASHV